MDKESYFQLKNKLDKLEALINGGKGSGNFGHAGREGKVGGSAPAEGGSTSEGSKTERDKREEDRELKMAGAQSRIDGLTSRIQSFGEATTSEEHDQLEQMKKDLSEAKVDKLHYETGLEKDFLREVVDSVKPLGKDVEVSMSNMPDFEKAVKKYFDDNDVEVEGRLERSEPDTIDLSIYKPARNLSRGTITTANDSDFIGDLAGHIITAQRELSIEKAKKKGIQVPFATDKSSQAQYDENKLLGDYYKGVEKQIREEIKVAHGRYADHDADALPPGSWRMR